MSMFKKSENFNPNYLASICKIEETFPIEGADRLIRTVINGYDMVVSKDMKPGDIVLYFPVETAICEKFLGANNLYEISEAHRNSNFEIIKEIYSKIEIEKDENVSKELLAEAKSMCGFFNKHGRVRMLKLRGQYSMGFVTPISTLCKAYPELENTNWEELVGASFDSIGDELLCWKYVVTPNIKPESINKSESRNWKKLMRKTYKKFDKLIEGQFKFHYDTKKLEEDISILKPNDSVSISVKVHGTSVILSNILCNRKLSRWEKIKKFFGFNVPTTEYDNIYSSRKVIKNRYLAEKTNDFYGTDIWGDVNKVFSQFLSPGMTVYGEIVGYTTGTSRYIQKNHDYGCEVGQWKFMPYRITLKDSNGVEIKDLDVKEVALWVNFVIDNFGDEPAYGKYNISDVLMRMDIKYIGLVQDIYKDLDPNSPTFNKELLERMKNDTEWLGMEKREPLCKNKVPREGIVLRINNDVVSRAWKLKSKAHYELEAKQHDSGEADMEELS